MRPALAAAGALVLALSMTGAAIITPVDYPITFDGSQNRFDFVAAASEDPTWTPSAEDWVDAAVRPIVLDLAAAEALEPGEGVDFIVAVKNDGPLAGDLILRIDDPAPDGERSFFEQLIFTVTDGNITLLDGQISTFTHSWSRFASGETRTLQVRISLPTDLSDEWRDKSTEIRIRFEGSSL